METAGGVHLGVLDDHIALGDRVKAVRDRRLDGVDGVMAYVGHRRVNNCLPKKVIVPPTRNLPQPIIAESAVPPGPAGSVASPPRWRRLASVPLR
jgi:hypothetical protein